MIEKRDKPTSFRTSQRIVDILEEVCEIEHRTKGRMIEVMILSYYEQVKEKEIKINGK